LFIRVSGETDSDFSCLNTRFDVITEGGERVFLALHTLGMNKPDQAIAGEKEDSAFH